MVDMGRLTPEDEAFAREWLLDKVRDRPDRHAVTSSTPPPVGRGDWEEWAWLPQRCEFGHLVVMGKVSSSFVYCPCPAREDQRGHHVYYCGYTGCRGGPWFPPGHAGEVPEQS